MKVDNKQRREGHIEPNNAFVRAAEDGDVETIRAYLADPQSLVSFDLIEYTQGDPGDMPMELRTRKITPLMVAAMSGRGESVQAVLEFIDGEAVDEIDSQWNVALHHAASPDVIEPLVRAGGALEVTNMDGLTPAKAAALEGRFDLSVELINNGASIAPFLNDGHELAAILLHPGGERFLDVLIQEGWDINKPFFTRDTLLMCMCRFASDVARERVVDFLERGADLDAGLKPMFAGDGEMMSTGRNAWTVARDVRNDFDEVMQSWLEQQSLARVMPESSRTKSVEPGL